MKKTEYKLLDSGAWLAMLFEANEKVQLIVEEKNVLFTSVLSIFEIKRKLLQWKTSESQIQEAIDSIKTRSIILPIEYETAEKAVDVSAKNGLGEIDALIFATALSVNAVVVTGDHDFSGLPNTETL